MKFTPKQYAAALYQAVTESRPQDHDQILDNFLAILKSRGELGKFDEIEQEFYLYDRTARGVKIANVKSAKPLANSEDHMIIQELNQYLETKVELKKNVDQGLLGGVVIKVDDELLDGSVKKSLYDLKNELIK